MTDHAEFTVLLIEGRTKPCLCGNCKKNHVQEYGAWHERVVVLFDGIWLPPGEETWDISAEDLQRGESDSGYVQHEWRVVKVLALPTSEQR